MTSLDPQAPREDIRLRGFSRRVPVEQALAWVDAHAPRLGAEPIGAGEAAGRVPAGAALPEGADAVLPFGAAQLEGSVLEVVGAVAAGAGVERRGRELRA